MDVLPGQVSEVEELSDEPPATATRYGASDPNSNSRRKGFKLVKMPRGKQDFLEETGKLHRSASTRPGYFGAIFQAMTSSGFTNLGDFQPGLKDQAAQEQTNISLLCALILTLGSSSLLVTSELQPEGSAQFTSEDDVRAAFALACNLSNAFLMVGLMSSVVLLLAINECSEDHEVYSLLRRLGWIAKVPYACWIQGTAAYGFFAAVVYNFAVLSSWSHFAVAVAAPWSIALVIFLASAPMTVKALHGTKSEGNTQVSFTSSQIKYRLDMFVKAYGREAVNPHILSTYLRGVCSPLFAHDLTWNTKARVQTVLDEWQKKQLDDESKT